MPKMRYVIRGVIGHTHDHNGNAFGEMTQPVVGDEISRLYYCNKDNSAKCKKCVSILTEAPEEWPWNLLIFQLNNSSMVELMLQNFVHKCTKTVYGNLVLSNKKHCLRQNRPIFN